MQPEAALNSWHQWRGELRSRPVILGPLSGGLSNRSFLLDSDGDRMVLRLNGPDMLLPGANRNSEIDIWQAASQQGIAPPLLYVDNQAGLLVSTYINNEMPSQPSPNEALVEQAFGLLKQSHHLDVNAPTIDYIIHINQYWQIIESQNKPLNPALAEQREPMQALLEEIINSKPPKGLCHHDPVVANFVGSTDRLYLIDWEYAAHGMLIMDYAALGTEWGIDDSVMIERTGFELELLVMAKDFYKYMCELWTA